MRFTESHEWIQVSGKTGTVGITEYAQKELGEIVYIELPHVGQIMEKGQAACVLESTKAAADVYTPVSGKVTAVNEKLRVAPGGINEAAESEGWLFQLELTRPQELDHLLSQSQYLSLVT